MGSASIEARLLRSQLTDPIPPSSFYALSGSRGAGGEGGFPRSAPQPPVAGSSEPRMKKEGHHRPQSQSPLASRVFRVGKFAGKTFSEVAASDPSYCRWALGLNAPSGQVAEFVEFLRKPRPFQHAALSSPSPPEAAGGVSFAHRGGLPLPDASAAQISLGTTALDPQTNAPPLWEGKGKGGLLLPEEKPVDDAEAAAAVDAWACDDGFGGVVDFEVELEVEDSQQQQSEGPPARPSLHELPALHQHHHNHQPQNPVWPQAVSAQSPLSVVREECSVLKMWEGQAPPCLSPKDETSRGRRAALEELDAFAFKSEGESCAEAASPPHPKAPGAPAVVGSVPEPVDACLSVEICGKALFRVVSLEQAPRKRLALAAGGGGSSSLLPRGGAGFAASGSSSRRGKGNVWSPQLPRPVADFLRVRGWKESSERKHSLEAPRPSARGKFLRECVLFTDSGERQKPRRRRRWTTRGSRRLVFFILLFFLFFVVESRARSRPLSRRDVFGSHGSAFEGETREGGADSEGCRRGSAAASFSES